MAGCDINVIDLTPSTMKANPSNVYTITAQIRVKNSAVIKESLRPQIVIDGKVHPMSLAPGSTNLFEYDFRMPSGRTEAAYYMLVHYDHKTDQGTTTKEIVTELNRFSVENRYTVELEVNRAPVGTSGSRPWPRIYPGRQNFVWRHSSSHPLRQLDFTILLRSVTARGSRLRRQSDGHQR